MAAIPQWRLSGGYSNQDTIHSLGGAMSATFVPADLFNDVGDEESWQGGIKYRAIYLYNAGDKILQNVSVEISVNTTSNDDTIAIAQSDEGLNGIMEVVASEDIPPLGPFFVGNTPLLIDNIDVGQFYGIWVRRIVFGNATQYLGDTFTITARGLSA